MDVAAAGKPGSKEHALYPWKTTIQPPLACQLVHLTPRSEADVEETVLSVCKRDFSTAIDFTASSIPTAGAESHFLLICGSTRMASLDVYTQTQWKSTGLR